MNQRKSEFPLRKKRAPSKAFSPAKSNSGSDTRNPDELDSVPLSDEELDIMVEAAVHSEPASDSDFSREFPPDIPLQAAVHSEPMKFYPDSSISDNEDSENSTIIQSARKQIIQDKNQLSINGTPPESSEVLNSTINTLINWLLSASNIVFFTGAGISANCVEFPQVPPLTLTTKKAIRNRNYYEILSTPDGTNFRNSYLFGSILSILGATPGLNHQSLAKTIKILSILGINPWIITQNLDSLHEKANSAENLIHIHGVLSIGKCNLCDRTYDYHQILKQYQENPENHEIFLCKSQSSGNCKGVITPDMIEYGESVRELEKCISIAEETDLMVVIGTSLRVSPANSLVDIVKQNDGKIVLITRSQTPKDNLADLHFRGQLESFLQELFEKFRDEIIQNPKFKRNRKIRKKVRKIL